MASSEKSSKPERMTPDTQTEFDVHYLGYSLLRGRRDQVDPPYYYRQQILKIAERLVSHFEKGKREKMGPPAKLSILDGTGFINLEILSETGARDAGLASGTASKSEAATVQASSTQVRFAQRSLLGAQQIRSESRVVGLLEGTTMAPCAHACHVMQMTTKMHAMELLGNLAKLLETELVFADFPVEQATTGRKVSKKELKGNYKKINERERERVRERK